MIAELTGRQNPLERQAGSVAAAVEAVRLGAKIVRVHDVAQTVDSLVVASALGAFE
jgi:dihydropteroate synthase